MSLMASTSLAISEGYLPRSCHNCMDTCPNLQVMPCLHAFCDRCMDRLSRSSSSSSSPSTSSFTDYQGDSQQRCPSCISPLIPEDLTPDPQLNLDEMVQGLLSCLNTSSGSSSGCGLSSVHHSPSSTTSSKGSVNCTSCTDGGRASSRCRDCDDVLCYSCVQAHQRVRITKDHFIVDLDEAIEGPPAPANFAGRAIRPPNVCKTHIKQVLNRYCELCHVAVCNDCVYGPHYGHSTVALRDLAAVSRNEILNLMTDAKAKIAYLENLLLFSTEINEKVALKVDTVAKDVELYFKNYITELEGREAALLRSLETVLKVKNAASKQKQDSLQKAIMVLTNVYEELQRTLELGTDVDVLNAKNVTRDHLKEILAGINAAPESFEDIAFIRPSRALFGALTNFGHITSHGFGPKSVAYGHGLQWAPLELASTFEVQLRDHTGEDMTVGGEPLAVFVQALADEAFMKATIVDKGDGKYFIKYFCSAEGKYNIFVSLRGYPVHQSPYTITVRKGRNFLNISRPLLTFGSEGGGNGQLCRPWGVCSDREGNFVVGDRSNHRIQVFDSNGRFLKTFGSFGAGPGELNRPAGVAVNRHGHIVVADKDNHRIQVFTSEGRFQLQFGERGADDGQFTYPWDVAVDERDRILVSDTRNHRVQLFASDGTFLKTYGFGANYKLFDSPRGVAFGNDGRIYVTDFNNHRVVVIEGDFSHSVFLGKEGQSPAQFFRPQGICVDREGRIIVADSRNHRVQVFHSNGNFMCKFGSQGTASGQLDRPSGIAVTPEGRIAVVDFGNSRVQVF